MSFSHLTQTIGKLSAIFNRGVSRISTLVFLVGYLTFAKVWQPVYEQWGIPLLAVVVGLPVSVIVGSLVIGYLDFKYQIQLHETVYAQQQVGWDYRQIAKDIAEIKEKLP